MQKDKRRIPIILALFILIVGGGGGIFFAESSLKFNLRVNRVNTGNKPEELRITNLTSSLATISWVTVKKTVGAVRYGVVDTTTAQTKLDKSGMDERLAYGGSGVYRTHQVTLRHLQPQTTYAFVVQSAGKKYDNNGKAYTFTTRAQAKLSKTGPVFGKVVFADNKPAAGAIVYLQLEGADPLSTLVQPSGNWLIPLNIAHATASGLPISKAQARKIELYIRSPSHGQAQAIGTADRATPLPTIVIGQHYDFRRQPVAKKSQRFELSEAAISIIQPSENQALATNRPFIRGTGIPNQKVTITLESAIQTKVITIDPQGNWAWTPPRNLTPGVHTVTIKTQDKKGGQIILTRRFLVLKSGSQVLGEATPSATLTPSPTPTPLPTAIPTPVFATPTPIATSTPVSGNWMPTLIFIGLGAILVLFGLKFSLVS